jgi:hypothetical protein
MQAAIQQSAPPDNTPIAPDNSTADASHDPNWSQELQPSDQQAEQSSKPGHKGGTNPNSRVKDGKGISIAGMRPSDSRPPAVRDIGISPSQWAHLPPMARQQLLNAAQQGGPPGYQEMIKSYYAKIATFSDQDSGGQP